MRQHVLAARLDNNGDVLLAGPAIRAIAGGAREVTVLCGPRGRAAAELLPGVDRLIQFRAPWIDPEPPRVSLPSLIALTVTLARLDVDRAVIFTSFHQNALPLALLLRMAGVGWIGAISDDYPGSLLDLRHRVDQPVHEVERMLSLAEAAGFPLPAGDDARLAIGPLPPADGWVPHQPFVVVHPGASMPARAWSPAKHRLLVDALLARGWAVLVTGSQHERDLTGWVAGDRAGARDLGGALTFPQLAAAVSRAAAIVVGNTGPAHLAAAVGTPVVSLFAPTVSPHAWRPWRVPHLMLGEQAIACAGCHARACPVPGHPCLETIQVGDVVDAVEQLAGSARPDSSTEVAS